MRIRSTLDLFLNAYDAYVSELARRIEDFQYSVGGNVIAFEVETDVAGFIEFKPKAEAYVSELIKVSSHFLFAFFGQKLVNRVVVKTRVFFFRILSTII